MNLRTELSKRLIELGYVVNERAHMKAILDDWFIVFDLGVIGKRGDVAPFVGLRSEKIETLYSDLNDFLGDKWVPSIGGNIGYLIDGDYRHWTLDSKVSIDLILGECLAAVDILTRHTSFEKLIDLWANKSLQGPYWHCKASIAMYLCNMDTDAVVLLREGRDKYPGGMLDPYLSFCDRYLKMLEIEGRCSVPLHTSSIQKSSQHKRVFRWFGWGKE